jgi:hypothetical protein
MYPARCTGCRRRIGMALQEPPHFRRAVYCSELCALEPTAQENMEREDLWHLLIERGWSTTRVANRWDVAWSVVSRAVSRRKPPTAS